MTLCTSAELATRGSVNGVLAVCDSPLSTDQITAAPAFRSWSESTSLACLSLGDTSNHLPNSVDWLIESPFRRHVILVRITSTATGRGLSADALWSQLVATENVWTGAIAGTSPAPKIDWPSLVPSLPAMSWLMRAIQSVKGSTPRQTALLKAGLYLLHDYLDESHVQSQSMEGDRDADLWHAIMHRREPDYGNAKYWCRRVGPHRVHDQLAPLAAPILAQAGITGFTPEKWDALKFVDLCERVAKENSPANRATRHVQWIEMTLHLAHCAEGQ